MIAGYIPSIVIGILLFTFPLQENQEMQHNRLSLIRAGLMAFVFSVSFSVLACTPPEPPPKIDTQSEAKLPTVPTSKPAEPVK
jgi:VanZ family protein